MNEFSEFEKRVIERIMQSPAPGKHAVRSALRHLQRSFELADTMPEVAFFLAITAEEESATAVFCSIQRRKYQHSENLNIHSHKLKTALHPFLLGVGRVLNEYYEHRKPSIIFDTEHSPDGEELLRLRFHIQDESGREWHAMPLPALNFSISLDGYPHDFSSELDKLATERSAKDIYSHVKRLANRRNQALYASSNGIPHARDVASFLTYRKSVVVSHLITYLLIDQHAEHQLFVQQSLNAFLKMLGRLPKDT